MIALARGISKTVIPKEKLDVDTESWTRSASRSFVKTLGVLELLAAIGLVLPAIVDIAPYTVPVTAVCWAVLMIGPVLTHLRLGQAKLSMVTSFSFALAVFVAWDRVGPEPFTG